MTSADMWGPFARGLDEAERRARLRLLTGLAHVLAGPVSRTLQGVLAMAESDAGLAPYAVAELDALPAIPRRRILAAYGSISCTGWNT